MPAVGDTEIRFGRSYIFIDPTPQTVLLKNTPASTVGTYRLSLDDEYIISGDDGSGPSGDSITTAQIMNGEGIIKIGTLLYADSVGRVGRAIANDSIKSVVVGVALEEKNEGETITYGSNLVFDIFATGEVVENDLGGLLATGFHYYLSSNEAGKWTTTPDTATEGSYVVQCGTAIGTNRFMVNILDRTEV